MAALSIQERCAWLHMKSNALKARDLVELKFALKDMINEANVLLEQVDTVLTDQRPRFVED